VEELPPTDATTEVTTTDTIAPEDGNSTNTTDSNSTITTEPEVVVPEEPAKPRKVYKNQALGWAAYELAHGTFMGIFIPIITYARNGDCWS